LKTIQEEYLDLKMSVNEDVYRRMTTEFPECLKMWNEECKKYNEATDKEIGECGEYLTRFQVAVFGAGETIEEYLDDYVAYEAYNKNSVALRHRAR